MELEFTGELFEWRGPPPYIYVAVPPAQSEDIQDIANAVTYGWGCIPVQARIGGTEWNTSLFPKDGAYLVPIKVAVRRGEDIDDGDTVTVRLRIAGPDR